MNRSTCCYGTTDRAVCLRCMASDAVAPTATATSESGADRTNEYVESDEPEHNLAYVLLLLVQATRQAASSIRQARCLLPGPSRGIGGCLREISRERQREAGWVCR
jgi:hypothetical protein